MTSNNVFETLELLSERSGLSIEENLMHFHFVVNKMKILPYSFVKKHHVIPLNEEEGVLLIAVSDPYNLEVVEEIRCITGSHVKEVLASRVVISEAIERCYESSGEETIEAIQGLDQVKNREFLIDTETEYDLLEHEADSSVIKVFNMIFIEALGQGASDIHFEPVETGLLIRYRIDGVLHLKHNLSKEMQMPLASRIKVLARLDIAEQRLPQDGRIKLRLGGKEIDFRVSTVPVVFGERIVLRILDRGQLSLGLQNLGMNEKLLAKLQKFVRSNQGIILVTGPTGSGKTSTLYSALSDIHSSEVNIMTIEDPVEFKLEGMAQIAVNNKTHLTFAKGLRHILRQDPDVIMIGEIRDRETAEIAVQASLTGHLVLSTLHTNDAPSAVARLVDMGVEPYLLSSSLICVLAQRLVRKICPHCKESYQPYKNELIEFGLIEYLNTDDDLLFYRGRGCDRCFHSGYKGRYGIYELMEINQSIKQQMITSPDAGEIQKIALQNGMTSLRKGGIDLALAGITTLEEVMRVTRQIEEEVF